MKEIRENPTEVVKIFLFVDDIPHIKDPKDSIKKFFNSDKHFQKKIIIFMNQDIFSIFVAKILRKANRELATYTSIKN